MMDFVFLEYSFDPDVLDPEIVFSKLSKLGFILRSEHERERASFWNQNQSIIMVHEMPGTGIQAGVTGLGFMGLNNKMIDALDAQHDPDTSAFVHGEPGTQFKTVIIPAEVTANVGGIIKYSLVSKQFERSYKVIDVSNYTYPGITYVSGIVHGYDSDFPLEYYNSLGFRATKDTDNYTQLLSNSERFSIFLDRKPRNRRNTIVVCDTDDVFWTTACYTANQVNMTEFDNDTGKKFGALTHKIVGYSCVAEGTKSSYSISRFVPEALPGLDLIFRMRKQFLGIPERILELASA